VRRWSNTLSYNQLPQFCAWTIMQVAKAMRGSITVAAVDADAHKSLASEYGIRVRGSGG